MPAFYARSRPMTVFAPVFRLSEQRGNVMAKTACRVVTVMGMVAAGLAGTAPSALGEPELLGVKILVVTVAGAPPPPDVLVRAQTETARIYAAVGVRLVWEARGAPITADPLSLLPRLTMIIVDNPDAWPERVAASALGVAPDGQSGVGRRAYAFNERIQESGRRHGTDPAKILGYVMAHELGHLLLARGAHSSTGIMSGRWNRFEIQSVERSALRFTSEQAKSIRSTVAEMNAHRVVTSAPVPSA